MFRTPRMTLWLSVSLALLLLIAVLAPHLPPLSLYKLSLLTAAAWVGYWIDRGLFPYGRPDRFLPPDFQDELGNTVPLPPQLPDAIALGAAMLRRAIVIAAAMMGVALGA